MTGGGEDPQLPTSVHVGASYLGFVTLLNSETHLYISLEAPAVAESKLQDFAYTDTAHGLLVVLIEFISVLQHHHDLGHMVW